MSRVAVVKCEDPTYDLDRVESGVRQAVDLIGGIHRHIQPGARVLVKPNLLQKSRPEQCIITHPAVVRAVVRLVQEAGGQVLIGDSPGGTFSVGHLRKTYDLAGLTAIAEETGAELNFDVAATRVPVPDGHLMKALDLSQYALEADAIISVSKWKTHELMGFTGATKNLFGLVPGVTKAFYHAKMQMAEQFADMLLDISRVVRPAFHLMDAIVGMHGDGPSAGDPFPIGTLLASTDPLALDLLASHLAGMKPDRVLTLRRAIHHGHISGRLEDVEIVGAPLQDARVEGFRPAKSGIIQFGFLPEFVRRLTIKQLVASPRPTSDCIACGVCMRNCPVQAISMDSNQIQIDLGQCIRCYCCHELCPEQAIELTQPWIQKLIR